MPVVGENGRVNAEEMRLEAMEKIGDTKKRRGEGDGKVAEGPKVKKTRRSGKDTLDFMRDIGERFPAERRGNGGKKERKGHTKS